MGQIFCYGETGNSRESIASTVVALNRVAGDIKWATSLRFKDSTVSSESIEAVVSSPDGHLFVFSTAKQGTPDRLQILIRKMDSNSGQVLLEKSIPINQFSVLSLESDYRGSDQVSFGINGKRLFLNSGRTLLQVDSDNLEVVKGSLVDLKGQPLSNRIQNNTCYWLLGPEKGSKNNRLFVSIAGTSAKPVKYPKDNCNIEDVFISKNSTIVAVIREGSGVKGKGVRFVCFLDSSTGNWSNPIVLEGPTIDKAPYLNLEIFSKNRECSSCSFSIRCEA